MGQSSNIGQDNSLVVYGNPESFKKLIKSHGQLCKVKQALSCTCVATNSGSADAFCDQCNGDGYIYTYQRRFLVSDEDSKASGKTVTPYWTPILSVTKVQNVVSEVQGGITDLTVSSFSSSTITLENTIPQYGKRRVTYSFDGWTYVAKEKLRADLPNKLLYADGTRYDSGYQSSNPLNAFADIAQVVRIWNDSTGDDLTGYTVEGNTISTTKSFDPDNMYIEYYYADLTQVLSADVMTRDPNETWTHDLQSGECRMAFYPFWELSKADLIVLSATALYRNELLEHITDLDRLREIEVFAINDKIFDSSGNIYYIDTDYILQGRNVKWIGNKPEKNSVISVRYGYKPAYVVFEDNPQPNNLENKQYPVTVLAKSWSMMSNHDVAKLLTS